MASSFWSHDDLHLNPPTPSLLVRALVAVVLGVALLLILATPASARSTKHWKISLWFIIHINLAAIAKGQRWKLVALKKSLFDQWQSAITIQQQCKLFDVEANKRDTPKTASATFKIDETLQELGVLETDLGLRELIKDGIAKFPPEISDKLYKLFEMSTPYQGLEGLAAWWASFQLPTKTFESAESATNWIKDYIATTNIAEGDTRLKMLQHVQECIEAGRAPKVKISWQEFALLAWKKVRSPSGAEVPLSASATPPPSIPLDLAEVEVRKIVAEDAMQKLWNAFIALQVLYLCYEVHKTLEMYKDVKMLDARLKELDVHAKQLVAAATKLKHAPLKDLVEQTDDVTKEAITILKKLGGIVKDLTADAQKAAARDVSLRKLLTSSGVTAAITVTSFVMNPVGSMTGLVLTIGASVFGFTVSTWGIKWNQKSIDELARLRQDAHDMAGKVANCLQMLLEEVMDVLHQ